MPIVIAEFVKDPDSKLDYTMLWAPWLESGDALASATWTADPGITISSSPAASFTSTTATVWLEGGTIGGAYNINCAITTTGSRVDERTFVLKVSDL